MSEPLAQYVELLAAVICDSLDEFEFVPAADGTFRKSLLDHEAREFGRDWPLHAVSMAGITRLRNLAILVSQVVKQDVPGDLMECGVWRGGAAAMMAAALDTLGDNRRVWLADSFKGFPVDWSTDELRGIAVDLPYLAVSADQVISNFARLRIPTDRVRILEGWFKDTLPNAPIDALCLLRIDADLYSSTLEVLENCYGKLSLGGVCIVDDYGSVAECARAIDEFRTKNFIRAPMTWIDSDAVFWTVEA